jgi:hypothetical protein
MRYREALYDWTLFQWAITQPSLYVLGAGASRPQIGGDLSARIRQLAWANGVYGGARQLASPLVKRMLPFEVDFEVKSLYLGGVSQNELDAHTPPELVELLLARLLTLPVPTLARQYAFFDLCPRSVIFNFNNDNLAQTIHRRHVHLRPHGWIDAQRVHSPVVDRALQFLAIPSEWASSLGYHRPLPEPNDMTSRQPYRMLPRYFELVSAVVIIGYSFGSQPSGSLDDTESFEMITDLLRWRRKPVLVVDPQPEPLAFRLQAALKGAPVSMLRCKWNVLAEFLLGGGFARACAGDRRSLTLLYQIFEDEIADSAACDAST